MLLLKALAIQDSEAQSDLSYCKERGTHVRTTRNPRRAADRSRRDD